MTMYEKEGSSAPLLPLLSFLCKKKLTTAVLISFMGMKTW